MPPGAARRVDRCDEVVESDHGVLECGGGDRPDVVQRVVYVPQDKFQLLFTDRAMRVPSL